MGFRAFDAFLRFTSNFAYIFFTLYFFGLKSSQESSSNVIVRSYFSSIFALFYRYEAKMRQTEERMRALGLLTPSCVLTLDEWEIPRDRVVINRKLGEGAFGTVYGGEAFFDEKGWVSTIIFQSLERRDHLIFLP